MKTPTEQCSNLLGQTVEGAVVSVAAVVPASGSTPEYCHVIGNMPANLAFEMKLPTSWNKRTVFVGGGGFDGFFNQNSKSPGLAQSGYALITTNHGHTSNAGALAQLDYNWLPSDEALAEYAYLAVPRVLAPARAIMKTLYGDQATNGKTVYEGCSGGGRQGLIEAQRFPDLFDGIISRAPANAYTPQFLLYGKVLQQLAKPGASLSPAKVNTIASAILAKCDTLDGVADGIVSNIAACHFDPAELACTGAESDSCLTPAQLTSAQAFYAPTNVANGRYVWPAFPPNGNESGDPGNIQSWGGLGETALWAGYSRGMVAQDMSIDPLQFDPTHYTNRIDYLVNLIDAVNPDLSRFKARGGKLMLWHGMSDPLITPNNTIDYYSKVVASAGGQANADQFVHFYTAPGVYHCGLGPGADIVDLVTPTFEWIEKGTNPPSSLVATQSVAPAGKAAMTRPICTYPQYPKYLGSGDPNVASSFTCVSP